MLSQKRLKHIEVKKLFSDVLQIREQIDFNKCRVSHLRRIVSAKSGLPVGVFRLCTKDNVEIFDGHRLETYNITLGQTLKLHVWDGWNELLSAATQGHTRKVFRNASHDDQVIGAFRSISCA